MGLKPGEENNHAMLANNVKSHVLNFRDEPITVLGVNIQPVKADDDLPEFISDREGLNMLLSSGDWVNNGVSNVKEHIWYDIHVSLPEPASTNKKDKRVPLDVNAQDAIEMNKVICFVDYLNPESVSQFTDFFKNKISYIGTLDNRILPNAETIINLLNANGSVSKQILAGLFKKEKHVARNSFAGGCKTKKAKRTRSVRIK